MPPYLCTGKLTFTQRSLLDCIAASRLYLVLLANGLECIAVLLHIKVKDLLDCSMIESVGKLVQLML